MFPNDTKSLRTTEDLPVSGRVTHLQKEPQEWPAMVKVSVLDYKLEGLHLCYASKMIFL